MKVCYWGPCIDTPYMLKLVHSGTSALKQQTKLAVLLQQLVPRTCMLAHRFYALVRAEDTLYFAQKEKHTPDKLFEAI